MYMGALLYMYVNDMSCAVTCGLLVRHQWAGVVMKRLKEKHIPTTGEQQTLFLVMIHHTPCS